MSRLGDNFYYLKQKTLNFFRRNPNSPSNHSKNRKKFAIIAAIILLLVFCYFVWPVPQIKEKLSGNQGNNDSILKVHQLDSLVNIRQLATEKIVNEVLEGRIIKFNESPPPPLSPTTIVTIYDPSAGKGAEAATVLGNNHNIWIQLEALSGLNQQGTSPQRIQAKVLPQSRLDSSLTYYEWIAIQLTYAK